jgi:predicted ATP-dependent protease
MVIDPYTAFTGDINLDGEQWRVRGVSGLAQKLEAARRSGCRRVFIPRENLDDVAATGLETLRVIPVDDLLEVLL